MLTKSSVFAAALVSALVAGACEKAQLLAPTSSTISISAASMVLPSNGDTEVTAAVIEQAGTPVQNGTTVRFTTSLGRVDPVEAQTRNGVATTRFFANNSSGLARITATSGNATAPTGGANSVEITVGAAAVETVTLRANPGSIGPNGGSVELIATVVTDSGQGLPGVLVTFNADQGSLSSSTATTNNNGEARTTLTTSQQTAVSATAGTKTSSAVTVSQRAGPIVSITCLPAGSTTGSCSSIAASPSNNTASVVFTVTRPAGSSTLRSATIDFGDGTSQNLGNLAGSPGTATVTHTYAGPTGSSAATYTATVNATDINGESQTTSTTVMVTPRAPLSVGLTATSDGNASSAGQRWTFTATVTPADTPVQSYSWDFGDGDSATTTSNTTAHVYEAESSARRETVTVTVQTTDGRSATGRTEIIVDDLP